MRLFVCLPPKKNYVVPGVDEMGGRNLAVSLPPLTTPPAAYDTTVWLFLRFCRPGTAVTSNVSRSSRKEKSPDVILNLL